MKKLAVILFFLGIGFASNAQSDTATTFLISPNPVETDVTFRISYLNKDIKAIRIYDMIGNEVAYIDLSNKTGFTSLTLDISSLKTGIYFCNLYSNKGIVESRKMIKNK
ncbi:T9SS type A sorting domain-containing protein [Cytophaga aurantiaca]|uniref:T9SS type A sorting domain-containing protein n=1 Tax=Cytophaga aurantiaca TaxID=29530 RepID=UPI0003804F6D|nr:T9SS type A sorting domain-containing protein [Cytophaga aurantiaca]